MDQRDPTVTVTRIATAAATAAEECVTPRDPGSRIPPSTVCPPAPRKRPAGGFYTEDDDLDGTTGLPSRNRSRRFSKVAIRLVFDVVECAEPTEKRTATMTITDSHHETTHNDHTSDC